jgi:chorismate synthase
MFSINAVKGFELGSGFKAVEMLGSEHNDAFIQKEGKIGTKTNNSGGIQGGISNGEPIYFNVAFKPVATLIQKQTTLNNQGDVVEFKGEGRHDPCVVPRAVPIVDAMAALVLLDFIMKAKAGELGGL